MSLRIIFIGRPIIFEKNIFLNILLTQSINSLYYMIMLNENDYHSQLIIRRKS